MKNESELVPIPPGPGRGPLDETQWMLFRLYGVHSSVYVPGSLEPLGPWGWHRPLLCYTLHQVAAPDGSRPFRDRCDAAAARLGQPGSGRGRCPAGLTWHPLTISRNGRRVFTVLVGPYLRSGDDPRRAVNRLLQEPGMPAHLNRADLGWPAAQVPRVPPRVERELLAWSRLAFSAAASGRVAALPDAAWGSLASPVRYSGPAAASLYGIYVERVEGLPRTSGPGGLRRNGGELYVLESGRATFRTGGRTVPLTPGQGLFLLGGSVPGVASTDGGRVTGVSIMFVGDLDGFRPLAGRPLTFSPPQRAALRDLWSAGLAAADEPAQASQRVRFLDLLFSLLPVPSRGVPGTGQEPAARRHHHLFLTTRVKEFLWNASERPIARQELAAGFHMTATHLNWIFRKVTGSSILRYHRSLRMARARSLLRTGELNVGQVAARLGFSSIHHFSAEFKKVVGASPRRYARTART